MTEQASEALKHILNSAKEAENEHNIEEAIILYQQAIKKDPLNEHSFNRLMTMFRRQKDYKKELQIINNGIKVFEKFYKSQLHARSKTIAALSDKLNRSIGLADKKGNSLYNPEPLARWKKRKLVVEKKIKR